MGVAFPSQLQQYVNESGFSFAYGKSVISSSNDIGPDKRRRVTTRAKNSYSVTINVNRVEFDLFDVFYRTTTNAGILAFDYEDPITGDAAEFKIIGEPTINSIGGGNFQISMTWEKQ